jgi:hypothetical protein
VSSRLPCSPRAAGAEQFVDCCGETAHWRQLSRKRGGGGASLSPLTLLQCQECTHLQRWLQPAGTSTRSAPPWVQRRDEASPRLQRQTICSVHFLMPASSLQGHPATARGRQWVQPVPHHRGPYRLVCSGRPAGEPGAAGPTVGSATVGGPPRVVDDHDASESKNGSDATHRRHLGRVMIALVLSAACAATNACSTIGAGRLATVDGSALASHSDDGHADSDPRGGWLNHCQVKVKLIGSREL